MAVLLIKGGRVLSPEDGWDGELDVLVEEGVVREIGPSLAAAADDTLDARGQVVAPGLVDIHVHLREPGAEISENPRDGAQSRRCRRLYRRLPHAQHQADYRPPGVGADYD